MVKYYGRARTRTGSVNTEQLGLKQAGCPSNVGRQGVITRYVGRRVNCILRTCGWRPRYGVGTNKMPYAPGTFNSLLLSTAQANQAQYGGNATGRWTGPIPCNRKQPASRQMAGGVPFHFSPRTGLWSSPGNPN